MPYIAIRANRLTSMGIRSTSRIPCLLEVLHLPYYVDLISIH